MHPELKTVKESFYGSGAAYASLSGSGSALYALVESESLQLQMAAVMREKFPSYKFHPFQFPAQAGQFELEG
jgi:4-diphosphocytidyl-2C-methyl-D-erythritol kinase